MASTRTLGQTIGFVLCVASGLALTAHAVAQTTRPALADPVIEGRWLRPQANHPAVPMWGHAEGLRVGLDPLPGPRGLLRIYTPYLGQPAGRMINFIAIEPVTADTDSRGLSEMEHSALDNRQGKRFWTSDTADGFTPQVPEAPSQGCIEVVDGVEHLTTFVQIEPFANGASVYVRMRFRADRPHQVGLAVFTRPDSVRLRQCLVTATMGNWGRLRQLELSNRTVNATALWPHHSGDGFSPHVLFPLSDLRRDANGDAVVSATPDEVDPLGAKYAPRTGGWEYVGIPGRQTWRMSSPPEGLHTAVNGRSVYWGTQTRIPGGIAFENFELSAPFEQGQEFWFGVDPLEPSAR